mmetsp:Transcript_46394/g.98941  ORF Transcript_46394/g.98941 Transcript_46394/m.98941 type:complete len:238 (+) Transcript_46394:766-1479(+)
MQRAVAIWLGRGDVVLEGPRQWRPAAVHLAEHMVAHGRVLHGEAVVDDSAVRLAQQHYAQGHQIVDTLDATLVALHLLPCTVDGLGAASDRDGAHAPLQPVVGVQHLLQLLLCDFYGLLVVLHVGFDVIAQLIMLLREQVLEREVRELRLVLPHAQAVREGRKDLQRLTRDGDALLDRHVLQCAHVVQPIGELDDDDAPILCHRNEHGTQILHLLVLRARLLQPHVLQVNLRTDHLG